MVKLQVFGNNSKTVNNIKNLTWYKNDKHIKIYLPCNFEVNLITRLGVVALFSSPDPKGHVSYCHHLASVSVVHRKLFQKSSPLKVLDQ